MWVIPLFGRAVNKKALHFVAACVREGGGGWNMCLIQQTL